MRSWIGLAVVSVLTGCATTGGWERASYQLDVRGHPVAKVTLESPPIGNVVETHVEGDTAKVSVHYRGEATIEPVAGVKVEVEKVRLSEDSLPLVRACLAGKYEDVKDALRVAGSSSRDDLSRELLLSLSDGAVAAVERTKEGRRLLDRLAHELTDEYLSAEDLRQTHRILAHRAQRIGVEAFTRAVLDPKTRIFPVRRTGVTVFDEASPELRWMDGGAFHVNYPAHAYRNSNHGLDFRGEEVREDEIIGVKLYDEGGRVVFGPALMLVQHANQAKQQVVLKMAELAVLGLSAGLSGAAVKVTFLVWCDRAAVALGLLTSLIDEHRGWILERYGEAGERFLFYSDVVSSAVALYGAARVVTAAPKLVRSLRDSYSRFKAVERGALQDVERSTEELLRDFEGAEVISIDEARPPPVMEEPLQATGTDGRLIRLGEEGETTVASLRRGSGPNEPLRPTAPGASRAPRGGSGKVSRLAIPARDAEEAEALAAKFAEEEAVASGRRQTTSLMELEMEQRQFIPGIKEPVVDSNVGVFKNDELGTRYADHLVMNRSALKSGKPRGVVFSDKSRALNHLEPEDALAVARADAKEAVAKYGGRVVVRRRGHVLFGREVEVEKIYLVYEAGLVTEEDVRTALREGAKKADAEVLFR